MHEGSPFFSICVPTRNRHETLFYCLKTLLHQDFDSYEIIVSDNSDEEESTKVYNCIKELSSEKIKYFKQDKVLSMTANYEFSLSKAKGQFITCIGDDDGLVVNSLQYLYDFIKKYDARVVKCCEVCYWWIGSHVFPESSLSYPMERPVVQVLSKSVLEKVANFEMGYFNLPMLYYSFVSRKIIDEVVEEKGSFFQNSASIDMYSGFTIAYKTDSFFVADKPFSISGQSNKSNGAAVLVTYDSKISKEYLAQHSLKEVYDKYKIPFMPQFSLPLCVSLELSKFLDNNGIKDGDLNIAFRNILIDMLSGDSFINNINDIGLIDRFGDYSKYNDDISFIKKNFLNKVLYYPKLGNHDTNINKYINLDPKIFGVKDIYGAAVLCKDFIESKRTQVPIKILGKNDPEKMPKKSWIVRRAASRVKRALGVLLHG